MKLNYDIHLNSIVKKLKIINQIAETFLININIHHGMENP